MVNCEDNFLKKNDMGYMGFGLQRWITTLKPRRYFGKRNNPNIEHLENIAGHDILDYYHLKPNKLENLLQKKFLLKDREKLKNDLVQENKKQKLYAWIIIVIALTVISSLLFYFSNKFNWF